MSLWSNDSKIETTQPSLFLIAAGDSFASLGPRTPVNDLYALVFARHLGVILLTSDRHLREAAVRERATVHGTLWVLDEMARHALVPAEGAADALRLMLQGGRRLPVDEAHRRIQEWSGRESNNTTD